MVPLPTGTVTLLVTDVEGSTRLWEQHPAAMPAALARHDALLRQAIEVHGGLVFRRAGDAFYAAFQNAPAALEAALAAQRALHTEPWGATGPLRVRMALHTGTPEQRDGDYCGPPFNRLARLLPMVHGGQTLLSRAAADLVRDGLPPGVELRDLGEHHLRDLEQPERIFQVVAADLPSAFPPLRTARQYNLPAPPRALIGRQREVTEVSALLRRKEVRLVTLTGPGGTGKTRLSVEVASRLLDDFADGVYCIELASVSVPALVASTIAHTLGVKETGDQSLAEGLRTYLREKHLLLVLDNFEQVVAAAPLVADLLRAAPGLKILVTSRTPLHISGEHEFPVPPLALPERRLDPNVAPWDLPPPDVLAQYGAVALFEQRARRAARLRPHRGQRRGGGRDLPPPGWAAAGDRARRLACCEPYAAGHAGPPRPSPGTAHGWAGGTTGAPAHPPTHDRLELRFAPA